MRISGITSYSSFLYNLGVSQNDLQNTMEHLSSQKQVNKASDNPLAAAQIMTLSTALNQNATYSDSIKDALNWSQTQDSALAGIGTQMLRMRTLIQSSANGTNGPDELRSNKAELNQTIASVVDALNTDYGGRYVFSGKKTDMPPFEVVKNSDGDIVSFTYNGSPENQSREISNGVSVDLMTNGQQLMQGSTTPKTGTTPDVSDLGKFFTNLISTLNTGINDASKLNDVQKQLSGDILKNLDSYTTNFVNARATIGSVENRLTIADEQNTAQKTNLATLKSNSQDIDMAKEYMEYQKNQTTYQSTLAMGTKIMNTTILNYL